MADKSKRSIMDIMPKPQVGASKKSPSSGGPSFNWPHWRIWIISLLFPVAALVIVPLGRWLTQSDYTGWCKDIFGDRGIIMIAVSMLVAARFELSAENQIGKRKINRYIMDNILLVLALAGFLFYTTITVIAEEKVNLLLINRVITINIIALVTALISGTCSFIRRRKS